MVDLDKARIGIVGAGAIGGAVIDRLVTGADVQPGNIVACETDESKHGKIAQRFSIRVTADPCETADAELIVLAVPPLEVANILTAVRDRLAHRPVVVSFAAAVPLAFLESVLPAGSPVVRVNPNSPSLVGEGFNPVAYGSNLAGEARALADGLLSALGTSIEVSDEHMNLYTALSAVGPTYFLPVFDAIIAAGLEGGLSREAAVAAATATARGTAALVARRPEPPGELKLYTGLRPLEDDAVRDLIRAAADEAFDRMTGVQNKVTGS